MRFPAHQGTVERQMRLVDVDPPLIAHCNQWIIQRVLHLGSETCSRPLATEASIRDTCYEDLADAKPRPDTRRVNPLTRDWTMNTPCAAR